MCLCPLLTLLTVTAAAIATALSSSIAKYWVDASDAACEQEQGDVLVRLVLL
jgi:hypothetical protein